MNSFFTKDELHSMNFQSLGKNVLLSRKSSIYSPTKISIGDHVRIDDFCILSAGPGGICLGSYIHIAGYSSIIGAGQVTIGDFSNISSRVSIYSSSDDFSGKAMTNPMIPAQFTNVENADVVIGSHVIIGSGSIILPGSILGEGVAIGSLSLIKHGCEPFGIYAGVPARRIKERKRDFLEIETKFRETLEQHHG